MATEHAQYASWSAKSKGIRQLKPQPHGHCLNCKARGPGVQANVVYSLKWRPTDRYLRWGTLAHTHPGRPEADQCKSSEFLHELRISSFPRFWVPPTCLRAKFLWIDAIHYEPEQQSVLFHLRSAFFLFADALNYLALLIKADHSQSRPHQRAAQTEQTEQSTKHSSEKYPVHMRWHMISCTSCTVLWWKWMVQRFLRP